MGVSAYALYPTGSAERLEKAAGAWTSQRALGTPGNFHESHRHYAEGEKPGVNEYVIYEVLE